LASGSPYLDGITLDRLEREGSVRLNIAQPDAPFLPFANGGFRTASGKFEFGAGWLDYCPPEESRFGNAELAARYPLELISSKNDDSLNSTFGHRLDVDAQTAVLSIHPDDANARGIVDGMLVKVHNDRGSCLLIAKLKHDVARGVLSTRSVRWNMYAPEQRGVNQLTSERLTDIGGGPTFYSCLVEVTPVLPNF
jgi:anaerobic selenocysteine-containing dehydrogenase